MPLYIIFYPLELESPIHKGILIFVIQFVQQMSIPETTFRFFLFIVFSFLSMGVAAQSTYPRNLFISPVDIPMQLSGTFAELRANHFHSGIDIKTQGREGKKVVSVADGYISRIKVSPYGFGKAIYIQHTNGYTSVYGHLRNFSPEIEKWVKSAQYRLQKFDVDLFPEQGMFKLKQGQQIAWSGNSGSSQGPHLHFEIRDSRTEEPIDPILFGFDIKDYTRPTLNGLRIYPANNSSSVNGSTKPLLTELSGWGPNYRLKQNDTIKASGNIYFGLDTYDLLNGSTNKNGINLVQVYVDSVLQFHWEANKYSFSETRYINSLIDYAAYFNTGKRYFLTRVAPQNKLSMYKFVAGDGSIATQAGISQKIRIKIADGNRNESEINFIVKGDTSIKIKGIEKIEAQKFSSGKLNQFRNAHLSLSLPGDCLYDDISFEYSAEPSKPWSCSMIHQINDPAIPLHNYYDLSIRVDSACKANFAKLIVVKLNKSNKPTYVGGKAEGPFIKTRTREFGRFTLMADSTAPVIKAANIAEGKSIKNQGNIRMIISDNLSGINTYNAYLNGEWILMDYDAKNNLLEYTFDEKLKPGKNIFKLSVEDNTGNKKTYEASLFN